MIPTIEGSLEGNGFGAIVNSDPSPRTLNSSTTRAIGIAALKARLLSKSFKREAISPSCRPPNSVCQRSIIFRMEPSHSSGLSEVTESWISLENTLSFLKTLSIRMSELKLLPAYIKFKSILGTIWSPLCLINYPNGLPQIPKRVIDVLTHVKHKIWLSMLWHLPPNG